MSGWASEWVGPNDRAPHKTKFSTSIELRARPHTRNERTSETRPWKSIVQASSSCTKASPVKGWDVRPLRPVFAITRYSIFLCINIYFINPSKFLNSVYALHVAVREYVVRMCGLVSRVCVCVCVPVHVSRNVNDITQKE